VEICLAACPADPEELVLVHDGARPAVAPEDVRACATAASGADGAVLGRPVADTLKLVARGEIQSTVDRGFLFRAETPQGFSRELLDRALAEARSDGFVGTDEASAVERLPGVRLVAVPAAHPNPKLTTPADLPVVAALLRDSIV
jgi:2-C-methyl-D-erythritol 4-phosphate cytidylyltransferase